MISKRFFAFSEFDNQSIENSLNNTNFIVGVFVLLNGLAGK